MDKGLLQKKVLSFHSKTEPTDKDKGKIGLGGGGKYPFAEFSSIYLVLFSTSISIFFNT